jgi:class 3 adenylate cyclase/cell division septation protein DedD
MIRSADKVDALLKARAEIDEQLRQHKNALTVLFTDVVGSTSFFERNGDTAGLVMIHRHDEMAARAIKQHRGKVIKMIGDSAMAEFPDPASAVRAAVEIERQFLKLNSTLPDDQRMQVRIGIHTGVGFRKGNDVFGDVVNVASRIVRRSASAQILISRAMHEAVSDEQDLRCRWLNKITMDGRTEKEDVFEVIWTDPEAYRTVQEKASSNSQIPARYEALSQIGIGGTGIVYKVRDTETGEIVALKVLKPEIASDPDVQENFKRELCLARKITHKNVCRIYDFSRSNGTVCTSMELVEGESLAGRLTRAGALPLNEALDIAGQICAGLREAHAQGIVHRDLKPANIMLDRNGVVKIMDFGIARMAHRDGPMTGTIVGTAEYMAPEQAEAKPVTSSTDIYAVGLLLYEMITGTAAFGGDTPVAVALKQIREYPKHPREIVIKLSGAVDAVIMKCLQKDPTKRFQSVDALDAALMKAAKARPASPWEIALNHWLERAEVESRKHLQRGIESARAFLKRQDWSALRKLQKEPMAIAGIGCALIVFVLLVGWKLRTINAQPVKVAGQNASSQVAAVNGPASTLAVPAANSASPMESRQIDLYENVNINGGKAMPSAESKSVPGLQNVSLQSGLGAAPSQDSSKPAQSVKHAKLPSHSDMQKAKLSARGSAQTQPLAGAGQPEASTATAATPTAGDDSALSSSKASGAPEASAASAPQVSQPKPAADPAPNALTSFLEVAMFKDEAKADSMVDKLNQLGFHALLIHKNLLWMQSYHVQVGPYLSQKEIAEAQQTLSAQGFKVHPAN